LWDGDAECCPTAIQYTHTVSSCTVRQSPRKSAPHCLNYSSCSTPRTGTGVLTAISTDSSWQQHSQYWIYEDRICHPSPNCLGNSVHSTGPTEAVSATVPNVRRPLLQVLFSVCSVHSIRPSNCLGISTCPSKDSSTPKALLKVLSTVSKHGS
jgi:hypothetical protein